MFFSRQAVNMYFSSDGTFLFIAVPIAETGSNPWGPLTFSCLGINWECGCRTVCEMQMDTF